MNKKTVSISLATIILLGAGGTYYALDQQKKHVEMGVQSSIQDLIKGMSANLPKDSKFDVNYEPGLLGSTGTISLSDKTGNVFTAKYNIENNFNSLISGMYNIKGDVNVGNEVKKYVSYKGNFMELGGVVDKAGDFKLKLNKDMMDFNSEYAPTEKPEVSGAIKNAFVNIDYKKDKKVVDFKIGFDALDGTAPAMNFNLSKFEAYTLVNVQNKNVGKLSMTLGKFMSKEISLSSLKIFAEVNQKQDFYDVKTEMGVKEIKVNDKGLKMFLPKDNYFLNIKYSVNHIHKDLFEAYVKMYEDIVNNQGNEEEMKKIMESVDFKPQLKKALANAVELNIEDISFGAGEDKVAIAASIKTPTIDEAQLSMEKHATLKSSISLAGAFAEMGKMMGGAFVSPEALQSMIDKKDFTLEGIYEAGQFKINGEVQDEMSNTAGAIKEFLRKIDADLELKNEYLEQQKAMEELQKQMEPMSEAEKMLTQPSASTVPTPATPSISTVPLMSEGPLGVKK